jgi:hypothetical protein
MGRLILGKRRLKRRLSEDGGTVDAWEGRKRVGRLY